MTPELAHNFLLPAAIGIFAPKTRDKFMSPAGVAMMIAIGLQESDFLHRQQLIGNHRSWWQSINGPAVSFWQDELPTISLVLNHGRIGPMFREVLSMLGYPAEPKVIFEALKHNDLLAVAFNRLLLFTYPGPLPAEHDIEEGWKQYVWCWRPGKPKPERWASRYARAWQIVRGPE